MEFQTACDQCGYLPSIVLSSPKKTSLARATDCLLSVVNGRRILFPFLDLAGEARQLDTGAATTATTMRTFGKAKPFLLCIADEFLFYIADGTATDAEL